jgi:hypothetical protein
VIIPSAFALALLTRVRVRAERLRRDPGSRYRWLPNQDRFLRSSAKVRMIRQGNQWGGKSTAALYDVLCHLRGSHPYKDVPPGPVEWWVICAESSQSIAIQRKLWDLVDPDEVAPGCEFDDVRGFRGRQPVLKLRNGSICRFKTTGQRTITLAGATLDGVLFDEPPTSLRLYVEVTKRVMSRGGVVLLSMTPVNAGPLGWLSDLVASGHVEDHHARLEPEALIPVGETEPIRLADGTVCDAAWVTKSIADTPEYEREVVCHGEWEYRAVDRVFTAFTAAHLCEETPPGELVVVFGVDHGTKVGKQYALLLFLLPGERDEVWCWDETPQTENSTEEDDARRVLEMLARTGLKWDDVDHARGDRAYERGAIKKGNLGLQREIAKLLRKPSKAIRQIETAKQTQDTGRRSVDQGIRYLHRLMVAGRFHVHPRCTRLRESLEKWDGRQEQSRHTGNGLFVDSYYKDPIDALRYALEFRVFASGREQGTKTVVRFTP